MPKQFKDILREIREKHDMTQRQLAHTAGITPAAISLFEGGIREPRSDTLINLAEVLQVTTDYLVEKKRTRI